MIVPGSSLAAAALEEALALAGVGCWLWDGAEQDFRASSNFSQLLGYESLLPSSPAAWLAMAHADDRDELQRLFDQLSANKAGNLRLVLRLRHAGGLWHWFDVRSRKLADDAAQIIVTFNDITQQKQSEAALRDSQLRYRALYNTSPLAFVLWDRQGHITEWNRRAEQMFGWAAREVIGKRIHHQLLPPELHASFNNAIKALTQGSGNGNFNGPAQTRDGQIRQSRWSNVTLRAANGSLLGILSLIRDVTDEHAAHAQLEKSEKVYRTLVETSPDAILLLGRDGRLQMANQQAYRLFGLDELDELGSTAVADLFPSAPGNDAPAAFLDHPDDFTGFIVNRQVQMRRLGGESFDAAIAFTTVTDSTGESSGTVIFVRNISEQLRTDRELEHHRENLERLVDERTHELETARSSLAKIIDASPVPTFVIDASHVITHWNRACEKIIGVGANEMIGSRNQWKAFYPGPRPVMADLVLTQEMAQVQALYSNKYRQSQLVEGAFEAEDYFPKFDRWLFFTAAPLHDAEGNIVGAIETLQDVTERKLAEIALTDAKGVAESAANAKAEFLANMSHEIRTPMNAVIGLAHLLLKTEMSSKQRDYVSRIHGAGQILLGLINDILDFSKIEAGRMQLENTEFRLDDVLDKVATIVVHRAQEKGLELHYVVEPQVPASLVGDPLRLAQILINLIGNAIKFTAQGSVTVFLRTQPVADDRRVRLEVDVQDSGIGMSTEQQGKLFQAFSQADTSITRKFGGTGLGLTICKRLTQMMQGDIWATSQPGVGSTFSFSVEMCRGSMAAEQAHPLLQRVLVVDDNPLARAILVRLLEKFGSRTVVAETGEQALTLLTRNDTEPFDCVTIDLNMPGMGGLELAEAIRARSAPLPKLVLITASDTTTLDEETRLAYFDSVINKPVTAAQIEKLVAGTPAPPPITAVGPAPLAGLRVLLVEDMPTNQLIAREILESFGVTVFTVDDGHQAIAKMAVDGDRIDIVLMDIQMPGMDGLEATRRLRETGRWPTLPIIAMTAHALDEERKRSQAAGMNDFITKPIDPEQLQQMLNQWQPRKEPGTPLATPEVRVINTIEELPALPGIDIQVGLKMMLNKPRLYAKILRDFHARFFAEAAHIRAAIAAADFQTAIRRAHSAKGLAGSIGAAGMQAAAQCLEQALTEQRPPPDELLERFEAELNIVIDGIGQGFELGPPS